MQTHLQLLILKVHVSVSLVGSLDADPGNVLARLNDRVENVLLCKYIQFYKFIPIYVDNVNTCKCI